MDLLVREECLGSKVCLESRDTEDGMGYLVKKELWVQ